MWSNKLCGRGLALYMPLDIAGLIDDSTQNKAVLGSRLLAEGYRGGGGGEGGGLLLSI